MTIALALIIALQAAILPQNDASPEVLHRQPFAVIERSASGGDKYAQFELAERYEAGIGVDRNVKRAIYWYSKAAKTIVVPTYVYLGPIGKASRGRAIEIGQPQIRPGLPQAAARLSALEPGRKAPITPGLDIPANSPSSQPLKGLSPPASEILVASGVDLAVLMATPPEKPVPLRIAGIDGFASYDRNKCAAGELDIPSSECHVSSIKFQANFPVKVCISIEKAEIFLEAHGWRTPAERSRPSFHIGASGEPNLPPIQEVFVDRFGDAISLSPYLKASCLNQAKLDLAHE
ncbi:tetratricopeptide repeat protein [Sphingomonas abietis]|uniref:SEL1-like repeat protein n=1 Tax=Sphingomonas abietis TaxID=3012344 RepID=A0ABY7NSI1_9SPHN|nr:SEL1-like repeat protein [Sphingomonas abietis]WBO24460.1 SEL1-like repeat protein [Sphingomonas abietis]